MRPEAVARTLAAVGYPLGGMEMGEWRKRTELAFEALNRGDLDRAIDLRDFDEQVEWVDPELPVLHGVVQVRGFLESLRKAFPDFKVWIRDAIECDNAVALEITWTGTHLGPLPMGAIPPTGKHVEVQACFVSRIKDEKIVHLRVYTDNVKLMTQLGLIPALAGSAPAR